MTIAELIKYAEDYLKKGLPPTAKVAIGDGKGNYRTPRRLAVLDDNTHRDDYFVIE